MTVSFNAELVLAMDENVIEQFHGVYLLYCTNPKYKGRTYIGYTVNPNRRIKQHNKGKQHGGAWKTSNRGPWEMVLIVHGFPNDISALRFEWAWQHPHRSRRLRHVARKRPREKSFDFAVRVVAEMLRAGPWRRLPLIVRWLKQEFARDFPEGLSPPGHMPLAYGPVAVAAAAGRRRAPDPEPEPEPQPQLLCSLCGGAVPPGRAMRCLRPGCLLLAHIRCLGAALASPGRLLPVQGRCPACAADLLWGDLVRRLGGCSGHDRPSTESSSSEEC